MTSTADGTTTDPTAERHWICARRLRERRRQLGLTQIDVAHRLAEYGAPLTNRTLSAMENGRGVDLGRLPHLAVALDCTVTYLLGLTADPARWEPDGPLISSRAGAAIPRTTPDPPTRNTWILGPEADTWASDG